MKKLLAWTLVLCMAFTMLMPYAVLAEETTIIETELADALDLTAEEWFESAESRAMVTLLLLLDYALASGDHDSPVEGLGSHTSYVGYSPEGLITVMWQMGQDAYYMTYAPGIGAGYDSYKGFTGSMSTYVKAMEESMDIDFVENDVQALMACAEVLQALMEE